MAELAGFLGIAILVIVTPGQDTALTIRNTLLGGRRGGVTTAVGVASGQACWTAAASIGLAALLVASEPVFEALKLVGAAYLVYLGLHALRDAIRRRSRETVEVETDRTTVRRQQLDVVCEVDQLVSAPAKRTLVEVQRPSEITHGEDHLHRWPTITQRRLAA